MGAAARDRKFGANRNAGKGARVGCGDRIGGWGDVVGEGQVAGGGGVGGQLRFDMGFAGRRVDDGLAIELRLEVAQVGQPEIHGLGGDAATGEDEAAVDLGVQVYGQIGQGAEGGVLDVLDPLLVVEAAGFVVEQGIAELGQGRLDAVDHGHGRLQPHVHGLVGGDEGFQLVPRVLVVDELLRRPGDPLIGLRLLFRRHLDLEIVQPLLGFQNPCDYGVAGGEIGDAGHASAP